MWQSENVKPPDFQTVFLYLIGDDVTTGWYSSKADSWIGLAFNQSPPTYKIEPGAVTHWQIVLRPTQCWPTKRALDDMRLPANGHFGGNDEP